MAGRGDGLVIIPWYATGFRADGFERALRDIAAVALRYNAANYAVYRARDDRYRFQQLATFAEYLDWERYWEGPEMTEFRIKHSSWYQVPVLYGWWDVSASGGLSAESLALQSHPAGDGNGTGNGAHLVEGESA
jgi:hypothetical protein